MKVLITGANGLLGYALQQLRPKGVELVALGHGDFDLTKPESMARQLDAHRPDVVINTAAYNKVDQCEVERDLSWAVNATGPEKLAELCREQGCKLVHYGTDYVFDGTRREAYVEEDKANPVNHYAVGKLYGEQGVLAVGARAQRDSPSPRPSPPGEGELSQITRQLKSQRPSVQEQGNLVLRVSWLFGWHPTQTKSYVHIVLNAARKGQDLKATIDQSSVPTYVPDVAQWTFELIERGATGVWHAVNDEGVSRFEWTKAILEEAERAGLELPQVDVEPVTTAYFNPTMRRPDF
ncbi:MAG TPA: NAD(P)-dependent oxidoreductase, partial [Candidatus Binatia bacterium]|nr:NAD(P)-dependent oxidoreductase [Candidatus Binatia bacterium]